jgi:hypothetical protein
MHVKIKIVGYVKRLRIRIRKANGTVSSDGHFRPFWTSLLASLFSRYPSGSSWWCSRRAWRFTGRRWRTNWTVSRGCCGGATTASTAHSTLAPTLRTSRPSAQIWPPSLYLTTRPELTEPIQVHLYLSEPVL